MWVWVFLRFREFCWVWAICGFCGSYVIYVSGVLVHFSGVWFGMIDFRVFCLGWYNAGFSEFLRRMLGVYWFACTAGNFVFLWVLQV